MRGNQKGFFQFYLLPWTSVYKKKKRKQRRNPSRNQPNVNDPGKIKQDKPGIEKETPGISWDQEAGNPRILEKGKILPLSLLFPFGGKIKWYLWVVEVEKVTSVERGWGWGWMFTNRSWSLVQKMKSRERERERECVEENGVASSCGQ